MTNVAYYRKLFNLTQKDMAQYLDISIPAYWRKEKGQTSFNDKEKLIIKKMLSKALPAITIDEIFFGSVEDEQSYIRNARTLLAK